MAQLLTIKKNNKPKKQPNLSDETCEKNQPNMNGATVERYSVYFNTSMAFPANTS